MAGSINLYWVIGPALSVGGLAYIVESTLARHRRAAIMVARAAAGAQVQATAAEAATDAMAPVPPGGVLPVGLPEGGDGVPAQPQVGPPSSAATPEPIEPVPSVLSDRTTFLRAHPPSVAPASAVSVPVGPCRGFSDFTADLTYQPPMPPAIRFARPSRAARRASRIVDAANARAVRQATTAPPPRVPGPILGPIEPRTSRTPKILLPPDRDIGFGLVASVALGTIEDPDRFDADYLAFVDEQWAKDGVDLSGYTLTRHTADGPRSYEMHALVAPGYLNCWDDLERKTFSSDRRHSWTLDGSPVAPMAFKAMLRGVAPDVAFLPDPHPSTPAEAVAKDRHETADRRILMHYRNGDGVGSYRIISRPHRVAGGFSACCHFRYGKRRQFRFDRAISFANAATGEPIAPDAIFRGNRQKNHRPAVDARRPQP